MTITAQVRKEYDSRVKRNGSDGSEPVDDSPFFFDDQFIASLEGVAAEFVPLPKILSGYLKFLCNVQDGITIFDNIPSRLFSFRCGGGERLRAGDATLFGCLQGGNIRSLLGDGCF